MSAWTRERRRVRLHLGIGDRRRQGRHRSAGLRHASEPICQSQGAATARTRRWAFREDQDEQPSHRARCLCGCEYGWRCPLRRPCTRLDPTAMVAAGVCRDPRAQLLQGRAEHELPHQRPHRARTDSPTAPGAVGTCCPRPDSRRDQHHQPAPASLEPQGIADGLDPSGGQVL